MDPVEKERGTWIGVLLEDVCLRCWMCNPEGKCCRKCEEDGSLEELHLGVFWR